MKIALLTFALLFVLQIHALAATSAQATSGSASNTANAYNPGNGAVAGGAGLQQPGTANGANTAGGGGSINPSLTNQNPNAPVNAFPNSTPSTAQTPNLSPDNVSQ